MSGSKRKVTDMISTLRDIDIASMKQKQDT